MSRIPSLPLRPSASQREIFPCLRTTSFTYDYGNNTNQTQGNGNLLNDGVRIYQWDTFNRLVQISKVAEGTPTIATYVYDALGRRIQKTIANLSGGYGGLTGDIPAGVINYLYDGQQVAMERNGTGDWTKVVFWGQYIDELMFFAVPTETVPTTYRVLSDLLYRSVALVDTTNTVLEVYDTDAYGNTLCFSGPGTDGLWFTDDEVTTNNPINTTIFTGREYDLESQIYYYRARYYSPTAGRFIGRDPIGTNGGINLYEYVKDNPANKIDPMGLMAAQPKCTDVSGTEQYADSNGWTPRGLGYELIGGGAGASFSREIDEAKGLWTAQITVNCTACCKNTTATGTRNFDSNPIGLPVPVFVGDPTQLPQNPATGLWEGAVNWLYDRATEKPIVYVISKYDSESVLGYVSNTKPSSPSTGQWASGTPCK